MAQGKLKVKAKVPKGVKVKKGVSKQVSSGAITKRANRPAPPKKREEANKLKEIITKTVNKTAEEEIRSMASGDSQTLSRTQEAVAAHNLKNS